MELGYNGYAGRKRNCPFTGAQDSKYFPPGPGRRKVITKQYLNRIAEKRARQQQDGDEPPAFDSVRVAVGGQRVAVDLHWPRRDYDEREFHSRRRRTFNHDVKEGEDLARSQVPLPYGGQGPIRRPTLEREEAFKDPTTCKTSGRSRSMADSVVTVVDDDTDPETAQLYKLGLLYDDEHSRGAGFNLNTIVHPQPEYSVRYAKRQRRSRPAPTAVEDPFMQKGLSLHLSFAQLGKDEMIAKYLISPSPSEINSLAWESTHSLRSGAVASVHSLHLTEYFPSDTQDTRISDDIPDLIKDNGSFEEPQTTQVPDFDCDSDTTSLTGSDADLVILPLHLSREEDERTRQSATPRRLSLDSNDEAAASWIMLGDDS